MEADPLTLYVAHDFVSRLLGLHGVGRLHENSGLWLLPCNAVHTFGMNYDIDVVFLDRQHGIFKQICDLRPNRVARCPGAHSVVELRGGYCGRNPGYVRVLQRAIQDASRHGRRRGWRE